MLGGFMSGLGMALSYFAANLYYLFFTFGVLAGKFKKYGTWLEYCQAEGLPKIATNYIVI